MTPADNGTKPVAAETLARLIAQALVREPRRHCSRTRVLSDWIQPLGLALCRKSGLRTRAIRFRARSNQCHQELPRKFYWDLHERPAVAVYFMQIT